MTDRGRMPVVIFTATLVLGLLGLGNVARSPLFDSYRSVDVVQLVASGACFGAAIVGLVTTLRRPRP